MWVALRLQTADSFATNMYGGHLPVEFGAGIAGYLPVYKTREAAEKEYPEGPIMEIRFSEEEMQVS